MRAVWRALPLWPYPDEPQQVIRFGTRQRGVDLDTALAALDAEILRVDGYGVEIGAVMLADNITLAGALRSRRGFLATGIEVSFDSPIGGRLSFHTNAFRHLAANAYAIARGLESLRLLDRYGITQGGQQYAGWLALPAGDVVDPDRGRRLAEEAGGLKAALKRAHPDQGGNERDLADVMAYKAALGA